MATATITRYAKVVEIDPDFGDRAPDWELVNKLEGSCIDVEDGMTLEHVNELVWQYVCDNFNYDINDMTWVFVNADLPINE